MFGPHQRSSMPYATALLGDDDQRERRPRNDGRRALAALNLLRSRVSAVAALTAAAALFAAAPGFAAGPTDRYASVGGVGTGQCTDPSMPCSLPSALSVAANGDDVTVMPGT